MHVVKRIMSILFEKVSQPALNSRMPELPENTPRQTPFQISQSQSRRGNSEFQRLQLK